MLLSSFSAFDQQQGQFQTGVQRIRMFLQIGAHQRHAALGHAVLHERFGIEQIERHVFGPNAQGLFQQNHGIGGLAAHQPDAALHPDLGRNRRFLEHGRGLQQGRLVLVQQGLGVEQIGIGVPRFGREFSFQRAHGHVLQAGWLLLQGRGLVLGGGLP